MKVASFFSGIGGFDLGLERAGMDIVFQCELDTFCQAVLRTHWPNTILVGDINDVSVEQIPQADVWCGGFPCQDVSLANQGRRAGLKGSRSGLFFQFAELISEAKPNWIIIENVPGLLNSNNGKDFKVVLQTLDELGYGVSWRVLDAKYFGTPQRRRRVFIVASYQTLCSAEVLFEPNATTITTGQGYNTKQTPRQTFGNSDFETNLYSIQHAGIGRKASAGPQGKGYRNDGETFTLDSRGSSDAICQTHAPFGVREASRVSGGLDGRRYRALGNAVAVPVIEWIGRRILYVQSKYATP